MSDQKHVQRFVPLKAIEVATGLNQRTVTRMVARGEIPSVRLGGRRLVPVAFLDELEARAQASVRAD